MIPLVLFFLKLAYDFHNRTYGEARLHAEMAWKQCAELLDTDPIEAYKVGGQAEQFDKEAAEAYKCREQIHAQMNWR